MSKFVHFDIKRGSVNQVIETMSKYRCGMFDHCDLNIVAYGVPNGFSYTYRVQLHVKKRELELCLCDVLNLTREGVFIDRLYVD